ncbi:hypothetical protein [Sphaerisporangium aureirubrum]|uniref:BcpO-related WXXGXW repeat protein n=1 Tax=Sphaerisporangium aureirubrum TaxID=1544736 RepID=A0ABW1NAR6_9ACTN
MSKITRRLATAAATLTVAGGILLSTGGAASAATSASVDGGVRDHASSVSHVVRHESKNVKWDGHRWWHRYSKHGDWYSTDHGRHYRFDGHRFYRWNDGKWKRLSNDYARHHGFDRHDFSSKHHHGHSGH